jgi:hypothetical protein
MADSSYGNAMTEVALALAMAFFSIMVLTMVSMSATPQMAAKSAINNSMKVADNKPFAASRKSKPSKKQVVIYWNGAFMDQKLAPIQPETFNPEGRVILALPPDLPMNKALAARSRFRTGNITVSTLDARWLSRLSKIEVQEAQQ